MKNLLTVLFIICASISYAQKAMYFECSKIIVNERDSNQATTKNYKSIIKIDFENSQIGILTFTGKSKNGEKVTYSYFTDIKNDDGSHSYAIKDHVKDTVIMINLDTSKKLITLLEDKYYMFYYENSYAEN